jgi:hypothetical protein
MIRGGLELGWIFCNDLRNGKWICDLRSVIYRLINSIWSKEKLPQQWREYVNVLIYRKRVIKLTEITTEGYTLLPIYENL